MSAPANTSVFLLDPNEKKFRRFSLFRSTIVYWTQGCSRASKFHAPCALSIITFPLESVRKRSRLEKCQQKRSLLAEIMKRMQLGSVRTALGSTWMAQQATFYWKWKSRVQIQLHISKMSIVTVIIAWSYMKSKTDSEISNWISSIDRKKRESTTGGGWTYAPPRANARGGSGLVRITYLREHDLVSIHTDDWLQKWLASVWSNGEASGDMGEA